MTCKNIKWLLCLQITRKEITNSMVLNIDNIIKIECKHFGLVWANSISGPLPSADMRIYRPCLRHPASLCNQFVKMLMSYHFKNEIVSVSYCFILPISLQINIFSTSWCIPYSGKEQSEYHGMRNHSGYGWLVVPCGVQLNQYDTCQTITYITMTYFQYILIAWRFATN